MACLNPQLLRLDKLPDGKYDITFYGSLDRYRNMQIYRGARTLEDDNVILVPCGHCRDCRMSHAREWAMRCRDELSFWEKCCFITLTYNDDNLPEGEELCKRDYQLFFKRLRKYLHKEYMKAYKLDPATPPWQIAYFGCGEYGRCNLRPHYHFIVYGWCPPDAVPWSNSGRAVCCRSAILDSLWSVDDKPIGYATVGDVTDESINYVCRYSLKKLDLDTSAKKVQPFTVASTRPAIGLRWLRKYYGELLVKSGDGAILRYGHFLNGHILGIPRYYGKKFLTDEDRLLIRSYFKKLLPDVNVDDLIRSNDYASYMDRLHNTHYGRDVLAQLQTPNPEEITR